MAARKKMTRKERSRKNKAAHKARQHRVRGHLARNAGAKPGKHRVRGYLAKSPTRHRRKKSSGRKRHLTAAQRKAALRNLVKARAARKVRGRRLASTYSGPEDKGFLDRSNALSAARASGRKVRRDRRTGRYHLV